MIELQAAQEKVLAICEQLPPQNVELKKALDTVVAEDIFAREQVPAFDNSAMDGFALKAADTKSTPARLEIVGEMKAGDPPIEKELENNQAIRIMTGAPIPAGADAILEVEATEIENSGVEKNVFVIAKKSVAVGNFIRRAGEDISLDQKTDNTSNKIINAGDILSPARLGVLASQGIYEVVVYPKCKVGVMSTGSELTETSKPLKPGQIRDSNRHTLLALLNKMQIPAMDFGLIPDTEKSVSKAFVRASKKCDVLLTSGGVSMGDFDYVKKILAHNIQIAIKPSKPLAFGKVGKMLVLGLPGNPVSSAVSFELFARPALKKMMGFQSWHSPRVKAIAKEDLPRSPDGKTHFMRVAWEYTDGKYEIISGGKQGSHLLNVLANSNGLAIIEDGDGVKAGEEVELIII